MLAVHHTDDRQPDDYTGARLSDLYVHGRELPVLVVHIFEPGVGFLRLRPYTLAGGHYTAADHGQAGVGDHRLPYVFGGRSVAFGDQFELVPGSLQKLVVGGPKPSRLGGRRNPVHAP